MAEVAVAIDELAAVEHELETTVASNWRRRPAELAGDGSVVAAAGAALGLVAATTRTSLGAALGRVER